LCDSLMDFQSLVLLCIGLGSDVVNMQISTS
jgi:hypothetical protein